MRYYKIALYDYLVNMAKRKWLTGDINKDLGITTYKGANEPDLCKGINSSIFLETMKDNPIVRTRDILKIMNLHL